MASETAGKLEVAVHQGIRQSAAELEEQIWTNLVFVFNSGKLDWDKALAAVAKVAMLRELDMTLEHKARQELFDLTEAMKDGR